MSESRRLYASQTPIELLREIDQAGQKYKTEHQKDNLYKEALDKPIRAKRGIDYVDDFANNFGKMRNFKKDVESMPAEIKFEIGFAGVIQYALLRLIEDIKLFEQAPEISHTVKELVLALLKN